MINPLNIPLLWILNTWDNMKKYLIDKPYNSLKLLFG